MAVKPCYADLIKDGSKKVELRRVAPKAEPGDILIIYESAPISKVTSYAEVESIVQLKPDELWKQVGNLSKIDKCSFDKYFLGKSIGTGIMLKHVEKLLEYRTLEVLPNLRVPQNYRYISEDEFHSLCG